MSRRALILKALLSLCIHAETAYSNEEMPERAITRDYWYSPNTIELRPVDLFQKVSESVWMVLAINSINNVSQGSAVVIAPDLLITNCHVVAGAKEIVIKKGDTIEKVQLLWGNEKYDRCILFLPKEGLTPVTGMRSYKDLKVGEEVYTVGSPRGLEMTLGQGIISGLRDLPEERIIQTSAPVSNGSSGGGLFDKNGNLIGITTFMLRDAQSMNFAIAVDDYFVAPPHHEELLPSISPVDLGVTASQPYPQLENVREESKQAPSQSEYEDNSQTSIWKSLFEGFYLAFGIAANAGSRAESSMAKISTSSGSTLSSVSLDTEGAFSFNAEIGFEKDHGISWSLGHEFDSSRSVKKITVSTNSSVSSNVQGVTLDIVNSYFNLTYYRNSIYLYGGPNISTVELKSVNGGEAEIKSDWGLQLGGGVYLTEDILIDVKLRRITFDIDYLESNGNRLEMQRTHLDSGQLGLKYMF